MPFSLSSKGKGKIENKLHFYLDISEVNNSDIFLEEPELNLFPTTQYELINWIIEHVNDKKKHTLFIATHSPYIMTSINNMLKAGNIIAADKNKIKDVEMVLKKERILSYKDINAFTIKNGKVKSIMDKQSNLISADSLDSASDIIEEEFDKLLWL